MRVFIVSVPSIGHVRSMAPVARCLVSRGHEVHWAANGTVSYVQATGVTLHSVLPDDLSEEGQRFSGGRAHEIDNWFLQKWFVPIAEQALRPTLKLAEIVEPDLVVTDATALWGGIVAESIGRPWASYCPGLFMSSHARQLAISELQRPQEPMNWAGRRAVGSSFWALERRLNALRHEVGLPSEPSLNRVSEALILCFTTRAVEFDGAGLPPQARCVGPVFNSTLDVDPFPAEDPDIPQGDEPLVYVSLGRVYGGMQGREDDIVDALAHLDVRAVVAGGTNGRPYASNRRIRYATRPISQSAVLRHAAAVVSGGFNTVHEALSHGLPVVAVPLAGDEPALAGRIDELGLGWPSPEAEAALRRSLPRFVGCSTRAPSVIGPASSRGRPAS